MATKKKKLYQDGGDTKFELTPEQLKEFDINIPEGKQLTGFRFTGDRSSLSNKGQGLGTEELAVFNKPIDVDLEKFINLQNTRNQLLQSKGLLDTVYDVENKDIAPDKVGTLSPTYAQDIQAWQDQLQELGIPVANLAGDIEGAETTQSQQYFGPRNRSYTPDLAYEPIYGDVPQPESPNFGKFFEGFSALKTDEAGNLLNPESAKTIMEGHPNELKQWFEDPSTPRAWKEKLVQMGVKVPIEGTKQGFRGVEMTPEIMAQIENVQQLSPSLMGTQRAYGGDLYGNGGVLNTIGQGLGVAGQIAGMIPGVGTAIGAGANLLGQGLQTIGNLQNSEQPIQYQNGGDLIEFNGNVHEQGGIPLGQNVEVEDGETKVGDYIFSNRIKVPGKKKTFADESKKIKERFKERPNDTPSQRTMERQLEALREQQEAEREKLQKRSQKYSDLADPKGEFNEDIFNSIEYGEGGRITIKPSMRGSFTKAAKERGLGVQSFAKQVMAIGGDRYDDTIGEVNNSISLDDINLLQGMQGQESFVDPRNELGNPTGANYQFPSVDFNMPSGANESSQVSPTEINPLGFAASNIGNIYNVAAGLSPTEQVDLGRMTPEQIDLSGQRQDLERRAGTTQANLASNIRNVAPSSGAALSSAIAGNVGVQEQLGSQIGQSYIQEETANTASRQQAQGQNLQIGAQEAQLQAQNDAARRGMLSQGLSGIGTNVQGFLQDKNLAKGQDVMNQRTLNTINDLMTNYNFTEDQALEFIKNQNGQ